MTGMRKMFGNMKYPSVKDIFPSFNFDSVSHVSSSRTLLNNKTTQLLSFTLKLCFKVVFASTWIIN